MEENQDHQKRQKEMRESLSKAVKSNPTSILKEKSKQLNAEGDPERMKMCEMSRMLFHEGLEQYEKGKLDFNEFVEDLHGSMAAIGRAKGMGKMDKKHGGKMKM